MKHTTIAVDLAKTVFEVAISNRPGKIKQHRRLSRTQFLRFFAQQSPATILLEACGSSHHWARELQKIGHAPKLLPPHHVRRYRAGNKTDRADAKALLEADRNEEILPVPIKSVDQQALTALHRMRSRYLATRTARINTLRGILREFGLVAPRGGRKALEYLQELIMNPEVEIPMTLRPFLDDACQEIRALTARMKALEEQLDALGKQMPAVEHLKTVPGIGLLTATALVALVGDASRFPTGRHLASYLGLTPREFSSGESRRRGRITKRGDVCLPTIIDG